MGIELAERSIDYRDEADQHGIILRLQAERKKEEVGYFEEGAKYGYGWAQHSHYIEVQYILATILPRIN